MALENEALAHGEAAEWSGIEPRSLYDRMKRHRLRKEDYRSGWTPPSQT